MGYCAISLYLCGATPSGGAVGWATLENSYPRIWLWNANTPSGCRRWAWGYGSPVRKRSGSRGVMSISALLVILYWLPTISSWKRRPYLFHTTVLGSLVVWIVYSCTIRLVCLWLGQIAWLVLECLARPRGVDNSPDFLFCSILLKNSQLIKIGFHRLLFCFSLNLDSNQLLLKYN